MAIRGIARIFTAGRVQSLLYVESVTLLDPLDVAARVDELRFLRHGWLEGHGRALDGKGLDWFTSTFEAQFDDDLPLPYVFPTEEGWLRLEWELGGADISVDIDLQPKSAQYHGLELDSSAEVTESLNLESTAGWVRLRELLLRVQGGHERRQPATPPSASGLGSTGPGYFTNLQADPKGPAEAIHVRRRND